jgi:hypothetical protein
MCSNCFNILVYIAFAIWTVNVRQEEEVNQCIGLLVGVMREGSVEQTV